MIEKNWHDMTALELGAGIGRGDIKARDLTEYFLDRIKSPDADPAVFITVTEARARAEAEAATVRADAGLRLGPLDGVPMAWKDLTDTAGIPTTFGSALFRDRVPAEDAQLLKRAGQAGMICLGKTNLSEFAYSGLGINPTFGTPLCAGAPGVNDQPRVPGGSSSGSGVAVASGLAPAAIGSDTGGSVRIPACINGIVGLKTTIGQLPLAGIMALSPSLDTIGPLTKDVADANAIYAILAGAPAFDLRGASLRGTVFLKPTTLAFEDLDPVVATASRRALDAISDAGARIVETALPELAEMFEIVATYGNIVATEGYALWGDLLESRGDEVYHGVRERFELAKKITGINAERAHLLSQDLAARFEKKIAGYDAVILPTLKIPPPPLAGLETDRAAYDAANLATTQNTRFANALACCALTLPSHGNDELPVGLTLMLPGHREGHLLRLASAVENALRPVRG